MSSSSEHFQKIIYIFGNGMSTLKMCTSTPTKRILIPGEIYWIDLSEIK